jgi:hypothetical protein
MGGMTYVIGRRILLFFRKNFSPFGLSGERKFFRKLIELETKDVSIEPNFTFLIPLIKVLIVLLCLLL